jgi:PleD family two-component response regulator
MARVLIVQGHARSRADTAATLRAEGHDVLEAGSADNGVRMAHEQGPEVILLDPMLPDRSGYELYASLQRDPTTLAIPVLFLPGELPPVAAEEGVVPVAGLDIVTRLGLALRTKSLNDELRLADVSLRSAVLTDSLTGLARLGMGPIAVILADMDGFAEVNERCGYAVGDRLLQAFAGLLHESCRSGDTVAHLEAEAFRRPQPLRGRVASPHAVRGGGPGLGWAAAVGAGRARPGRGGGRRGVGDLGRGDRRLPGRPRPGWGGGGPGRAAGGGQPGRDQAGV